MCSSRSRERLGPLESAEGEHMAKRARKTKARKKKKANHGKRPNGN